ncbi:ABC transporter substrate-binding protein [Bradyrhizobium sp.]|uniref:ABC transporter substrate-binding protein n=1 Tax=Bradyrhizobium sp. TaxID=376 RepID=UPI0039E5D6A2
MRRLLTFILAALLAAYLALAASPAAADEPVVVTDITGRTVTLPHVAKRVLLAEGRQIIALSLLDPRPVDFLSAWLGDFRRNDSESYAQYRQRFPEIDQVPVLGVGSDGTFPVERAIEIKPDVAVLGVSFAPGGRANDVARQLEAAGIPVVFTDFFVAPFEHTVASVRILGRVIGRDKRADEFAEFYEQHMNRIAARVASASGPRPRVLLETHAGIADCCHAPGAGNIGRFIAFAGGDSISAAVAPGPTAQLSLEYVISSNPEVYIGTGGAHLKASGGLVIGPGFDAPTIRERLAAVVARPGFAGLSAVRNGRVHGLFHNIISTPLNVVAAEALARWIDPAGGRDIDPDATIAELNARFLAVPLQGVYWIDLK